MQSGNDKPDAAESKAGDPKALDPKGSKLNAVDPQIMNPEIAGPANAKAASRDSKLLQAEPVRNKMTERRFAQVSRRELLKVAPVLALGAFAVPRFQQSLLKKGLEFSDWASARSFRR